MTNRIRTSPTRFSDEVFTPGSNNKYTKGRNLKIRNQENDINNLSKSTDFSNFYNLSVSEYKKKLEDYNKSNNYPKQADRF